MKDPKREMAKMKARLDAEAREVTEAQHECHLLGCDAFEVDRLCRSPFTCNRLRVNGKPPRWFHFKTHELCPKKAQALQEEAKALKEAKGVGLKGGIECMIAKALEPLEERIELLQKAVELQNMAIHAACPLGGTGRRRCMECLEDSADLLGRSNAITKKGKQ